MADKIYNHLHHIEYFSAGARDSKIDNNTRSVFLQHDPEDRVLSTVRFEAFNVGGTTKYAIHDNGGPCGGHMTIRVFQSIDDARTQVANLAVNDDDWQVLAKLMVIHPSKFAAEIN